MLRLAWTGGYTRYVKVSARPYIVTAAVAILVLAAVTLWHAVRRPHEPDPDDGHDHDDGHGDGPGGHRPRRRRVDVAWAATPPIAGAAVPGPPAPPPLPRPARPAPPVPAAAGGRSGHHFGGGLRVAGGLRLRPHADRPAGAADRLPDRGAGRRLAAHAHGHHLLRRRRAADQGRAGRVAAAGG